MRLTVRGLLEIAPPVNSLIARLSELLELRTTDEALRMPAMLIPVPVAAVLLILAVLPAVNAPFSVIALELARVTELPILNGPFSVIALKLARVAEPLTVNAPFVVIALELARVIEPLTVNAPFSVIALALLRVAEPPTVNALFSMIAPELLRVTPPVIEQGKLMLIEAEFVREREANDWVLEELRVVIFPAPVMLRLCPEANVPNCKSALPLLSMIVPFP